MSDPSLPEDVVQFLRAHMNEKVASDLLCKYGDDEVKLEMRRYWAIYTGFGRDMHYYDRYTAENIDHLFPASNPKVTT